MTAAIALIIGASRGPGLALAAEHLQQGAHVVATVRGPGRTALHDLPDEHLEIEHVDITEPEQVTTLRQRLDGRACDELFVNAGWPTASTRPRPTSPPRSSSASW